MNIQTPAGEHESEGMKVDLRYDESRPRVRAFGLPKSKTSWQEECDIDPMDRIKNGGN